MQPKQNGAAGGSYPSKRVPLSLLQQLKPRSPIPVTITATSFAIPASRTKPLSIWNGRDFFTRRTTSTFNWSTTAAAGITILNATTGAVETGTSAISTGVWYFYMGEDTAGAVDLVPSKISPSFVEGPFESGPYAHPGTAKTRYWNYVGWQVCTTAGDDTTEPAMLAATKKGYWYNVSNAGYIISQEAETSAATLVDFSAVLPVHGVEVAGYITPSTEDIQAAIILSSVDTGASATLGAGIAFAYTRNTDAAHVVAAGQSYDSMIINTAGALYQTNSVSTEAAITSVTRAKDVV